MEFINQYADEDNENMFDSENIQPIVKEVNTAPEVDISTLTIQKEQQIVEKFNSGYYIPDKPNHITGYINYHKLNDFNFKEQLYTYNAYGFAQDPTDFSQNKIIGNVQKYTDGNQTKSVFLGSNKSQKEYRKNLKMKRTKYGDPGSGDFQGPWAIYEGEQQFKNLSGGELTEEQKLILQQLEEQKNKKLEEAKLNDMPKVLNVILFNFSSNPLLCFICRIVPIIREEAS
jgi:hypothetical protein